MFTEFKISCCAPLSHNLFDGVFISAMGGVAWPDFIPIAPNGFWRGVVVGGGRGLAAGLVFMLALLGLLGGVTVCLCTEETPFKVEDCEEGVGLSVCGWGLTTTGEEEEEEMLGAEFGLTPLVELPRRVRA